MSSASYLERLPIPALRGVARTAWIQDTGDAAYQQRHLPTGGVELHVPVGGDPILLGALTRPQVELIPAHTTVLGVRFLAGSPLPLPVALDELVDARVLLRDLWGSPADALAEAVALASTSAAALGVLQERLADEFRHAEHPDPLVREAAALLMPWRPVDVRSTADRLALSESQLRRRCLRVVGLSPKVLQRTLRFQGFLALAQAGPAGRLPHGTRSIAGLAAVAGYADQAHLSRECVRLTGVTPAQLLHGGTGGCACGHDHSASYLPFLQVRPVGTNH
ncbi:helix-turn-helix domain-containing protein [Microbacterium arabinogalactanolyticum]|uniref:helix-turn-helix domain-containing protein n=1 Tax=Microbacterium arabinogalactanolyticum TaxID=69365 RepID=UPI002553A583|nr:helix-turn-helix domain-containing protein [Microbacterium arabinogalactanolyticum]GLC85955.1 AraC family transcriptional regulator [Microbacterium arabinogalactanolyticum]